MQRDGPSCHRIVAYQLEMNDNALAASKKIVSLDQKFVGNTGESKYSNCVFTRLVAKDKQFTKVNLLPVFLLREQLFKKKMVIGARYATNELQPKHFAHVAHG